VLMFAALHRAISRRSIFYYGLAGVSAGYGFICQADIMFLFALLAGTYAIFLFVRYRPGASKQVQEEKGSNPRELGSAPRNDRRQGWLGFLLINAGGVIVAAVFFLAISSMSLQNVIKTILPSRASIAKVAGTPQTKEENKWEFATNWSLPPEEILEFFAPGVFGLQTGDVRGPYWGRMGRTPGWEQHHQGLMNLRQHTVYLGVIQIVFAIYTVVWAVRRRGRNLKLETRNSNSEKLMVNGPDFAEASKVQGSKATGENSQAEDREKIRNRRADIFFWTGTFITAILLALGRYFPLYRLFYMLPYVSSMRCPAKFLHLVEFALCILFAFGLEAFSRDTKMVNAVAVKNGTQVEKRKAGKRS